MEEAFNNLRKAPKQEALLLEFLKINQDLNRESIDKKKLLNQTGISWSLKGINR